MLNMSFRYPDSKISKLFKHEDLQPAIKYHSYEDREMRYMELITKPELPYIVFIHGAPGSMTDYMDFFREERLCTRFNLLSVDRLGYGYSEFGRSETSIEVQGKAIHSILNKKVISERTILVGHSYGGPIAVRMAVDAPSKYLALILLAPALDPQNEKEIKIAQLAMVQPTRWLTPKALKVAADEKTSHVSELNKMLNSYDRIRIPVCHIHGDKDSLVPFANLAFSQNHIDSTLLESVPLKNVDHFLPWSHREFVIDKLLEYAE